MTGRRHRIGRSTAFVGVLVAPLMVPVVDSPVSAPSPRGTAACPGGQGGLLVGMQVLGAYTDNCDLRVQPPPAIGAAPSAGAIIACRNLPGCLPMFVNNPGWVQVPRVDTRVRGGR
jgi:hypothetical protein